MQCESHYTEFGSMGCHLTGRCNAREYTVDSVVDFRRSRHRTQKHKQYLVINLANELGFVRWSADPATALREFKNAYKSAIPSIREKLHMPVMIDAPDCGTSIDACITIGQELIDHDPDHNLLLSTHAYWAAYDGMPHIDSAVNGHLPIVFGEVANKQ